MKKISIALATAAVALPLFAQQDDVPEADNFYVGAKFAFESEYIYRGLESSDTNFQTTVNVEYSFAPTGSWGCSVYGELFYMSPIEDEANKLSLDLGLLAMYESEYFFSIGYRYSGYPNSSKVSTRIAAVNREHEAYIGVGRDIELLQGEEWTMFRLFGYFSYNFQSDGFIYEAGIEKLFDDVFGVADLGLKFKLVYGYIDQNRAEGDQNSTNPHWHNDYGYFAGSVDLSYGLTRSTEVFVGLRYAWNNDDHATGTEDDSNFWVGFGLNFRY